MPARILNLPDVTLLAVTSVAIPATAHALAESRQGIDFGAILFLSDQPPPAGTPATWRAIAPITSRADYSRYMLQDLGAHLTTSHALCVQWDGYVLNPAGWDPAFLEYDYIGAPWPHFSDGMQVGNGGFSLRSRRLVDACTSLTITDESEDVAICRTNRAMLERDFGIRFAPEDLARRFAYERMAPTGAEFGFHGAFNMLDRDGPADLASLLSEIEPGLLDHKEHREILFGAVRRGNWRLALRVWRRMRHPESRRR